jgi:hypothetical protein
MTVSAPGRRPVACQAGDTVAEDFSHVTILFSESCGMPGRLRAGTAAACRDGCMHGVGSDAQPQPLFLAQRRLMDCTHACVVRTRCPVCRLSCVGFLFLFLFRCYFFFYVIINPH